MGDKMRIQRAKVIDGAMGQWSAPLSEHESRGIMCAISMRFSWELTEMMLRADTGMVYTTRNLYGTHRQFYRYAR